MKAKRVLPLALLYTAGGHIKGRTRFQKLAFLSDQELEDYDIDPYDFIPYDYGPFDDSLYDNLEFLEKKGLIESKEKPTYGGDTRYDYRLTERGKTTFEENMPTDQLEDDETAFEDLSEDQNKTLTEGERKLYQIYQVAEQVVEEYNGYPISNLIDIVYDEYPEYAKNSIY
ncbi:PadR family transcriptional regulator [Halomicrobium sp. IBSBa]|uniref:PadR family transcriptional regulator n=1 Tax=Halomicrobium sp. IBSBa TaxID=2778916 RepID=UPI001ABFAB98|nr:PadR family transcriptional regulator [Halomicrobium sp. IBSBa]MBO4248397.1 PadR family transcriptional regulator [Halomicrobium sp. IBSBa]